MSVATVVSINPENVYKIHNSVTKKPTRGTPSFDQNGESETCSMVNF